MSEIFTTVSASPRLRRFSTSYMLIYFIITLSISLVGKYLPFVNTFAGGCVKSFLVYLIEGALMFGLVRGICEKDYKLTRTLSSFCKSENYICYLAYAVVRTVYDLIVRLVSAMTENSGALAIFGGVLMVAVTLIGFLLNFALFRLYYEKIIYKAKSLNVRPVFDSCVDTIKNKPGRILAAEIMMLAVKYIAMLLATALVSIFAYEESMLGIVNFVASCLVTIQFGALIYSWPVYYLYYKETVEK